MQPRAGHPFTLLWASLWTGRGKAGKTERPSHNPHLLSPIGTGKIDLINRFGMLSRSGAKREQMFAGQRRPALVGRLFRARPLPAVAIPAYPHTPEKPHCFSRGIGKISGSLLFPGFGTPSSTTSSRIF
jgi:hypothetical protein